VVVKRTNKVYGCKLYSTGSEQRLVMDPCKNGKEEGEKLTEYLKGTNFSRKSLLFAIKY
jgi:hypothetical protein